MGFERFGIKAFVSETKASAFVDYLQSGKVMTTRCKSCHNITFPPKTDCSKCGSSEAEWVEVEEIGKLRAFTMVMYGPAGFENKVPYTLGAVEFPNGVRMFGAIDRRIPEGDITVGMELKVVPVTVSDNRFSYQFERA